MKTYKPYIASMDDVSITRTGDTAIIEYKEENVGTVHLTIGEQINQMSDEDILECHNNCIKAQLESMKNYKHVAVEIPPGSPQIEYFEAGGYWKPRGDVMRCTIHDDMDALGLPKTTICIDDKEFSMEEFGRILSVYSGWGMRIIMVPDDETYVNPAIEVKEPEKTEEGSLVLPADLCSKKNH